MALAIRNGTEADAVAVLALWRAAEALPTVTDDEAGLRALLAADPGALLLAERDAELVGSLIAGWDGWRGSLYRLAVHPTRRREGIGAALVGAGERRLIGLWKAVGYERQAGRARFVRTLKDSAAVPE